MFCKEHVGSAVVCNIDIGRAVVNLQHLPKTVEYCAGNFGIGVPLSQPSLASLIVNEGYTD